MYHRQNASEPKPNQKVDLIFPKVMGRLGGVPIGVSNFRFDMRAPHASINPDANRRIDIPLRGLRVDRGDGASAELKIICLDRRAAN
jgi:hypothetical protein